MTINRFTRRLFKSPDDFLRNITRQLITAASMNRSVAVAFGSFTAIGFPMPLLAQANVFEQGASNLIGEVTLFALPFAVLAVMALGFLAAIGRISWGWPAGVLFGIAMLFGAPQIVGWIRNIFVV